LNSPNKHYGVARVISKRGFSSRSAAEKAVREGRVMLNDRVVTDPETPAMLNAKIYVDGIPVLTNEFAYYAFNKPRGIVTTASDEKGRKTVMDFIAPLNLTHLSPVGRLDMASEGLLLFTNDTAFANRILSPEGHLEKEYHVQVEGIPEESEIQKMEEGIVVPPRVFGDKPEMMKAKSAEIFRRNEKTAWLRIVLQEGKNREIRRILENLGYEVRRLVRVRIGNLELGNLKPGELRKLENP